tara:strand:+ start:3233 stop:3655 length:423 start_codon:yes stop_codon:yes gene_type:complete
MKGNLLLIDDEEMILESSKDLLEDIADNIYTANRGAKGVEIFKSETIHCILCDINMPEMNGIDVIKKIREINPDVPFIFYTAHGSDELMREAVKYGAFDFLDKPALEGLEEIVERGLKAGVGAKDDAPANFVSEFQKLSN